MMDPIRGVDAGMQVMMAYFRERLQRVQPVEPPSKVTGEYHGRKPEMLQPDTIPKPPKPEIKLISYPDLIQNTPDVIRQLLDDNRVRVRIHPEQFKQLQNQLGEAGAGILQSKFIIDPEAGRRVDTLA